MKTVDMEALDDTAKGKTCRGLYASDGDTLHLTYARPGRIGRTSSTRKAPSPPACGSSV